MLLANYQDRPDNNRRYRSSTVPLYIAFDRASLSSAGNKFPYKELVEENARRDRTELEYEIEDTGAFAQSRYWDVFGEYAKAGPDDLLIRLRVIKTFR